MGWLDEVKTQVVSLLSSTSTRGDDGHSTNTTTVVQILEEVQQHGLGSLVQHLRDRGLSEVVGSWIGTGPNQPVSAEQIEKVLGPEVLDKYAARLGLPPGQASAVLSQVLPLVVDRLTPHGTVEEPAAPPAARTEDTPTANH